MVNERKVPEIRFDAFAEPWEQHGLTDVLSPTVGNNTLSRAELNYDSGEVKNIHYGDVLIKFGAFVDAVNDEIPFITNGTVADHKNHLLQDGDVIFADTAEDETAGKVVEVTNSKETSIVSGLHTIVYRPKRKFADCFMGYYLNTNAYRYQLLPLMQGAKVLSLGRSHLATTFVRYPSELNEQIIISEFFRNLDDTIALKKQQYEQTANIKKAMLEKMFPKKGADVPEVRFEGFTGTWEVRKIYEIANVVTGSTPPTAFKEYYNGDFLFVSPADIQGNRYISSTATTLTKEGFSLGRKVRSGAALFVSIGSTIGKVAQATTPLVTNQQINSVIGNSEVDDDFIFTVLESVSHSIRQSAATQAVPIVNKTNFSGVCIWLPKLVEQKQIGNFFRNLDALITAQQEEVEMLQNIKKAFLVKMFI